MFTKKLLSKSQFSQTILSKLAHRASYNRLLSSGSDTYFKQNDHDDYVKVMKNLCEEQNAAARYIKMEHRSNESALSFDLIRNIQRQKENNSFKGASLLKDPFDEAILRRLIFDIKPMTIFEFGTFTGSSAAYMAMLVREYGLNESRIYTFDIFEDLRDKKIDNNEFIEYVICDLNNDNLNDIDALNAEKLLNDYKHPWLILEDSHSDIARLLNHFDENGMQKGDYIIIEDTTHGVPEVQTGASMEDMEVEKQDLNCKKMDALRDWMRINQPKGYRVDSKYCDAWGYNLTFNANGYIVKT